MSRLALVLVGSLCLPVRVFADTTVSGDMLVTGQAGVGTTAPRARLGIEMKEEDAYALKVSSQNGDSLLLLQSDGKLAVGLESAGARVDVRGAADDGTISLQLRVGNSSSTTDSVQIAFAQGSTDSLRRHSIRTRADSTQNLNNAVDFYLWDSTGSPNALGDVYVLSLQAIPDASSGSVHVMPFGDPTAELVVSSSTRMGGGTIQRAAESTHSSRELKTDIRYLGEEERRRAYGQTRNLRHAEFRYRKGSKGEAGKIAYRRDPQAAPRKGLIYEDVPDELKGGEKVVSLDARLLNMESALQETYGKIRRLEGAIAALEEGR